jgi:hypothetical protein
MGTSTRRGPQAHPNENVNEFPGGSRANAGQFEEMRDGCIFRMTSDPLMTGAEVRVGVVLAMHLNREAYKKSNIAEAFSGEDRLSELSVRDRRNLNRALNGREGRPSRLLHHLEIICREKGGGRKTRKTTHYRFRLNASYSTHFDETANASSSPPEMRPTGRMTLEGTLDTRPASAPDEPATADLSAPSGVHPGSRGISVNSNGSVAYAPPEKINSDRPNNSAGTTHNRAAPYEDPQPTAQRTAPDPWAGMTGAQIDDAKIARRRERWFAKRAEWGAEAQEAGYACREVRVTCDAGQKSWGLLFATEAIWPDWESKRNHRNEMNDLARMRCRYCGYTGTAVLTSRPLHDGEEWAADLPLAPSRVEDMTPRRTHPQRDQHAPATVRDIGGGVSTRVKPTLSDDHDPADYALLCGGGSLR